MYSYYNRFYCAYVKGENSKFSKKRLDLMKRHNIIGNLDHL